MAMAARSASTPTARAPASSATTLKPPVPQPTLSTRPRSAVSPPTRPPPSPEAGQQPVDDGLPLIMRDAHRAGQREAAGVQALGQLEPVGLREVEHRLQVERAAERAGA